MFVSSFMKRRRPATLLLLVCFMALVSISYQPVLGQGGSPLRGLAGDQWADKIIGQVDFGEFMPNEVTGNRVFNPGGVLVDRSVRPNRLYVYDSNSRILGFSHLGTVTSGNAGDIGKPCTSNSDFPGAVCKIQEGRPADLVLGQPALNRGACNGDGNLQNYPNRAPASASTLCTMMESQVSTTEGGSMGNMAVDSAGNLYVPDWDNNRVLRYNSPFTTDTIADAVWGQADFSGNQCNRGRGFGTPHLDAQSFCLRSPSNDGFVGGVAIDSSGNLWVSDNANNRVLRFPFNAGLGRPGDTADLVLGQLDFSSRFFGLGANQMHAPAGVRVTDTGRVYVADSQQNGSGNGRVLYFDPPYSNGMNATGLLNYDFRQPTGLEFDLSGGLWVSDRVNNQILLFSDPNTITKVLFKDVPNSAGVCGGSYHGDRPRVTYPGVPSTSYDLSNMCDSGGSIGVDSDGNVFASSRGWGQDVWRFPAPIPTPTAGTSHSADARLLEPYQFGEYNSTTLKSLWAPRGIAITSSQLMIADSARILFWNNPLSITNDQAADGYVGTPDPRLYQNGPDYGRIRQDKNGHLWVLHGAKIEIYLLPLYTGAVPFKTITSSLPVVGGGTLSWGNNLFLGGLAPEANGNWIWVSDRDQNRVFRISNPLTSPQVDIVLGQTSLSGVSCNQGLSQRSRTSLCDPGGLALDPLGNLYVSDHALEVMGNHRLLEFDGTLFPDNPPAALFGLPASHAIGTNGSFIGSCVSLCGPFEPAFSSTGIMVIGENAYVGERFPAVFMNPLVNDVHSSLHDYGSMPYAAVFDDQDNLYTIDMNRGRALFYRTPFSTSTPLSVDMSNVVPADNATGVPINTNITIPLNEVVITTPSAFTLTCGVPQPFTLTGVNTDTLTLDPSADLPANTSCTVTGLATGVIDQLGNPLPSDFALHFTTSDVEDTTPPTATLNMPAIDVPADGDVVLSFSEPVNMGTAPAALACPQGVNVAFTTTPSNLPANNVTTLTLDPVSDLPFATTCTVTLDAAKMVDAAGNPLGDPTTFSFTVINLSAPGQAPAINTFSTGTPTLTWSPISWAGTYEVDIGVDSAFKLPRPAGYETPLIAATPYVMLPTALPNGTYYFRVRAVPLTGKPGGYSIPEPFVVASG